MSKRVVCFWQGSEAAAGVGRQGQGPGPRQGRQEEAAAEQRRRRGQEEEGQEGQKGRQGEEEEGRQAGKEAEEVAQRPLGVQEEAALLWDRRSSRMMHIP